MNHQVQQFNNRSHLESFRPSEADILKSKIIARATVRHSHGKFVTIICAFQLSYEYRFWATFRARSSRTARKNWRVSARIGVHGYQGEKINLDKMIARTVGTDPDAKVTKRYSVGKRNFDANFDRVCYPFKYQANNQPAPVISTNYINRKFAAGRRGSISVGR